jgi:hypothetical protein
MNDAETANVQQEDGLWDADPHSCDHDSKIVVMLALGGLLAGCQTTGRVG